MTAFLRSFKKMLEVVFISEKFVLLGFFPLHKKISFLRISSANMTKLPVFYALVLFMKKSLTGNFIFYTLFVEIIQLSNIKPWNYLSTRHDSKLRFVNLVQLLLP